MGGKRRPSAEDAVRRLWHAVYQVSRGHVDGESPVAQDMLQAIANEARKVVGADRYRAILVSLADD